MRSRLEASFAAQLDREGTPWAYEPECFADEQGQYLPDFRVEGGGCLGPMWIEVKPVGVDVIAAARKMHTIFATDPHANLAIYQPEGCWPNVHLKPTALRSGSRSPWIGPEVRRGSRSSFQVAFLIFRHHPIRIDRRGAPPIHLNPSPDECEEIIQEALAGRRSHHLSAFGDLAGEVVHYLRNGCLP